VTDERQELEDNARAARTATAVPRSAPDKVL
jgi:hypothetical protein